MVVKYDLKITDTFSGSVLYEKEDYTTDKFMDIQYELFFKEGKIEMAFLSYNIWNDEGEKEYVGKWISKNRFKSEFWKHLPEYATFDDGCWKRKQIEFKPNKNCKFFKMTFPYTKCIV